MKNNIGIIGHFASYKDMNDGQTVKTREIYNELKKNDEYNITVLDTQNYKKRLFSFLINIFKLHKKNSYIIIIVASGGAKVLIPLLSFFNHFFKKKLCFCSVGSWLDVRAKKNKILKRSLKRINLVLVETTELKNSLEGMGFNNISIMYNFKNLNKCSSQNIKRLNNSFCTFSRVIKEKGVEDVIFAVEKLNKMGYKCFLDIYGPIPDDYKDEFNTIIDKCEKNIKYCGNVNPNDSIKYLSKYYMLIFPTHFVKEGLPGTLIDAYSAGTPVIASNWLSAKEFVPNEVGYIYDFCDTEKLFECMKYCIDNPSDVEEKRNNTLQFVEKFKPEVAIFNLKEFLK